MSFYWDCTNIICYKIRSNIHEPSKWLLSSRTHVIFVLQTDQKNNILQDASVFDTCNLNNVKLYLNSNFYPYDDLNLDFDKKGYAILFDMYARFLKAYYGINCFKTLFNVLSFIEKGPFARDKTNSSRTPLWMYA